MAKQNTPAAPTVPSSAAASGTRPAHIKPAWLPAIGSRSYYLMLGVIAVLVLGPLGGVTAAYMNFSLGFFIGGQVLAGILGSVVTLGYGPEGKHGANYMQTMAASVSGMAAMGVLIQAMVWLGMEQPPTWQLILFFLCIGMFGVGATMKRGQAVEFSKPYLLTNLYAVTRKDSKIKEWKDIDQKGVKAAVSLGSYMEPFMKGYVKNAEVVSVAPPNTREAELVAQHVEDSLRRLAQELGRLAVDGGGDVEFRHDLYLSQFLAARSAAMAVARLSSTPAILVR